MKYFLHSKVFIAVLFFCLGLGINLSFMAPKNVSLDKKNSQLHDDLKGASTIGLLEKKEDEKAVYYEIPLIEQTMDEHKFDVNIAEGVIKITEEIKSEKPPIEMMSERIFTIDPELDDKKAQIFKEKDKIIRIPKN